MLYKERLLKMENLEDDLVYIGVTVKTRDKYLISTDSDYNEKVIEYLKEEMEITHHNIKEAQKRCGLI